MRNLLKDNINNYKCRYGYKYLIFTDMIVKIIQNFYTSLMIYPFNKLFKFIW